MRAQIKLIQLPDVMYLRLDCVLAAEHVVDALEVVDALGDGVGAARGRVALLKVGLLAQFAHLEAVSTQVSLGWGSISTYLVVHLRGDGSACRQPLLQVQRLLHGIRGAVDPQREQARGQTTAVAEHAYPLALQGGAVDVTQEADQPSVNTGAVHVAAHGGHLDAGLHALGEALLGQAHERLLDDLVRQRLLVVHLAELGGHVGEGGGGGVGEVVVVEHACVRFRDKLAGGGVEAHVVEPVEWGLGVCWFLGLAVAVGVPIRKGFESGLSLVVGLVARIHGLGVAPHGEVAVDDGVLAGEVWLVEVVRVLHVTPAESSLDDHWRIGTDQHGDSASSSGWAGIALGIERDVSGHDDGVPPIPRGRLNPVEGVEDGVGAAVAGIDGVHALDIGVVAEQLHKDGLDGLGLVEDGLRAHLEAANAVCVDLVLAEEV